MGTPSLGPPTVQGGSASAASGSRALCWDLPGRKGTLLLLYTSATTCEGLEGAFGSGEHLHGSCISICTQVSLLSVGRLPRDPSRADRTTVVLGSMKHTHLSSVCDFWLGKKTPSQWVLTVTPLRLYVHMCSCSVGKQVNKTMQSEGRGVT